MSWSSFTDCGPPAPSHTTTLQSPPTWELSGVPFAVKLAPQTPEVHVRVAHSVSVPGHSDAAAHAVHAPSVDGAEPPTHSALEQSESPRQPLPLAQSAAQVPPQSWSVS
jgi:hypothetical protein